MMKRDTRSTSTSGTPTSPVAKTADNSVHHETMPSTPSNFSSTMMSESQVDISTAQSPVPPSPFVSPNSVGGERRASGEPATPLNHNTSRPATETESTSNGAMALSPNVVAVPAQGESGSGTTIHIHNFSGEYHYYNTFNYHYINLSD